MEDNRFVRAARNVNEYSREAGMAALGLGMTVLGTVGAYSKIEFIIQATEGIQRNGEMTMQTMYATVGIVGIGLVMKAYKDIRVGIAEKDEMVREAQANLDKYRTQPSNVVALDKYRNKDIA